MAVCKVNGLRKFEEIVYNILCYLVIYYDDLQIRYPRLRFWCYDKVPSKFGGEVIILEEKTQYIVSPCLVNRRTETKLYILEFIQHILYFKRSMTQTLIKNIAIE